MPKAAVDKALKSVTEMPYFGPFVRNVSRPWPVAPHMILAATMVAFGVWLFSPHRSLPEHLGIMSRMATDHTWAAIFLSVGLINLLAVMFMRSISSATTLIQAGVYSYIAFSVLSLEGFGLHSIPYFSLSVLSAAAAVSGVQQQKVQ